LGPVAPLCSGDTLSHRRAGRHQERAVAEVDKGEFASVEAARAAMEAEHDNIAGYPTPWWGDKDTENMKNRGFVIGFRNDVSGARWRLDFDPGKKLHINWSQDVQGQEATKHCYRVGSIRGHDTLFDYYTGWTRPRVDDVPGDIKGRLGTKKWNGRCWV
jgi:hypothetical protein